MTIYAFLLVCISACLHALWNFASKKVSGNIYTMWLGLCLAAIILTPAILISLYYFRLNCQALIYVWASGVIHALYFYFMSQAYKKGDISTVYPIARGTGIAGTTIFAYWALDEKIHLMGFIAILLILTGIFLISFRVSSKEKNKISIYFALSEGVMIIGYSLIDKLGITLLNPLIYIWGMTWICAFTLLPYIYAHRESLRESWKKEKWFALLIGCGSVGTYLLILFALKICQVSYVVAAREFSIVIGSILGFIYLKEEYSLRKGVGITTITMGLIVIKMLS